MQQKMSDGFDSLTKCSEIGQKRRTTFWREKVCQKFGAKKFAKTCREKFAKIGGETKSCQKFGAKKVCQKLAAKSFAKTLARKNCPKFGTTDDNSAASKRS
jgi:hypothetical protein